MAVVELSAPPNASATAEKTTPPAEELSELKEAEDSEEADATDQKEGRETSILGVLKGDSMGLLDPTGQGGVTGLGSVGLGSGTGQGFGGLGTRGSSTSPAPQPTVSVGASNVTGKLPPEVIRRVVLQHHVRIRLCYEKALANNPTLAGKITARFVIAADGSVSSASDGGSTMPDKSVIACALKVFQAMTFPKPADGATVTVNYPIVFASASPPAAPRPGPPLPPAPAAPPSP